MIDKITPQNLRLFAYTNETICKSPIKGIILDFHGLGFGGMINEPDVFAEQCAERGILFVFPYYGPWSWMNDTAVKQVDAVVDALFEKYGLEDKTPIVSSGGSMGGLSALIYTRYAKRTPTACAANCPVCDLVFHSTERDDLPRTIYQAFSHYDCPLEEAVKSASPTHQVGKMPDIPYYIVHGDADKAVNKQLHSDIFVQAMKANRQITYIEVPDMEHCALQGEVLENYRQFLLQSAQ